MRGTEDARPAPPQQVGSSQGLVVPLVHEIGNLLAALRLSAHVIAGESDDAGRRSLAGELDGLAGQAGALLAQLRPLQIGSPGRRSRLTPAEVLAGLTSAFADRRSGEVSLEIGSGAGLPELRAEPESLHHVLVALVWSALAASPSEGRVTVSARPEGHCLALVIQDDGPPLDDSALEEPRSLRGRELAVRVADAVLRLQGGRVRHVPRSRGCRVEVVVPAADGPRA